MDESAIGETSNILPKSSKPTLISSKKSCDKLKRLRIKRNKRKNYRKHLRKQLKRNIKEHPSIEFSATFSNIGLLAEWHSQHNAQYWKSRVLNLEFENRKLRDRIDKLERSHNGKSNRKRKRKKVSHKSIEIEVSDEWIKCITENKKIREQLKKEREKGEEEDKMVDITKKVTISGELEEKRRHELLEMYGEDAAEVKAYDAAVTLINEKYISFKKA